MKILWLCNIILPKVARDISQPVNNYGGWLTGLSNDLLQIDNIELIVCFPITFQNNMLIGQIDNLRYYGFPQTQVNPTKYNQDIELYFEQIIREVMPNIIHIFGTEYPHSFAMTKVCQKLELLDKVLINIQGLVSVYSNHYYASLPNKIINSYSFRDFVRNDNIKGQANKFKIRGEFEIKAFEKAKHVIGRTDWDKACIEKININAKYHFCNETLRDEFYKHTWSLSGCEKHSIFISQCSYPIKGFHCMLEAMPYILKRFPNTKIYTTGKNPLKLTGLDKLKKTYYEKYIGKLIIKYHLEDVVVFLGNLNEQQMCERYLLSNVFVSASSIENSPNSVGEAMLLGVPTISSDVGGVKNMLTHGKEGFIYPFNEFYTLAYYICKVFSEDALALWFSENSKNHAKITHSKEINLKTMLSIYDDI